MEGDWQQRLAKERRRRMETTATLIVVHAMIASSCFSRAFRGILVSLSHVLIPHSHSLCSLSTAPSPVQTLTETTTTRATERFPKRKARKKDRPRGTLLESTIMIPTGLLWFCVMVIGCFVSCKTHILQLFSGTLNNSFIMYSKEKKQHGGGGGKGKWNDLDDGTLDEIHTTDVVGETFKD